MGLIKLGKQLNAKILLTATILKEQIEFYKTLFSSEGWNEIEADLLVSNISTELSQYEMESCENSPTENEIHKAVIKLL